MSSVEVQIADIERELLALTGNQPVNPGQIVTYRQDGVSTLDAEEKTVVFDDGIPRFLQLYGDAILVFVSGDIRVSIANAGTPYTLISLGAFNLV